MSADDRRSKNSLEDEIAAEDKMVDTATASQNKRRKNREEREERERQEEEDRKERERQEEEDRKADAIQRSLDAGVSSRNRRNKRTD
jgi:hypothetical protein